MQPQRQTVTDSLTDIMQIVSLGNKSGLLTVERGEGEALEEGFILFRNGRIVEAKVRSYSGMYALNYLSTWQTCRFSFVDAENMAGNTTQTRPLSDNMAQTRPLSDNMAQTRPLPALRPGTNPLSSVPKLPPNITHSLNNQTDLPKQRSHTSCPIRLPLGEVLLQHSDTRLPRPHRRLLLLIDGQRNVSELARLMVRQSEEIQLLLDDLEHNGLIQQ